MIKNQINTAPVSSHKAPQIQYVKDIARSDASINILMHHLHSFQKNDLEALLSDYTNESILVTQMASHAGLTEIAAFFKEFATHFPQDRSNFNIDKITVENELVYIVWHCQIHGCNVLTGSDTFVMKDGKIYQQTFVGQIDLINI